MRGVRAKALRKVVYGDMSHRTREYVKGHEPQAMRPSGVKGRWIGNPVCICSGLRREYQESKKFMRQAIASR